MFVGLSITLIDMYIIITIYINLLFLSRSFMLSTAGFTCVAFVTGSLAWWGPQIMYSGLKMQDGYQDVTINRYNYN